MITITPEGIASDIQWLDSIGYWDDHSFKDLTAKHWQPSFKNWVLRELSCKSRLVPGSKVWNYGLVLREIRLSRELRMARRLKKKESL